METTVGWPSSPHGMRKHHVTIITRTTNIFPQHSPPATSRNVAWNWISQGESQISTLQKHNGVPCIWDGSDRFRGQMHPRLSCFWREKTDVCGFIDTECVLDWPACSPHLSPIVWRNVNVWSIMKSRSRLQQPQSSWNLVFTMNAHIFLWKTATISPVSFQMIDKCYEKEADGTSWSTYLNPNFFCVRCWHQILDLFFLYNEAGQWRH